MTTNVVAERATAPKDSGMGGQPLGLTTLFFTEMWERFSYYGMRPLLVLYMAAAVSAGGLGFTDSKATTIAPMYSSALYFPKMCGGFVADRFGGGKGAVLIGGIIIACGHFS